MCTISTCLSTSIKGAPISRIVTSHPPQMANHSAASRAAMLYLPTGLELFLLRSLVSCVHLLERSLRLGRLPYLSSAAVSVTSWADHGGRGGRPLLRKTRGSNPKSSKIRLIALPPAQSLQDVVDAMAVDRKTLKSVGTFQTAMMGNSTTTSRQFDMPSKRAARILVPSSTCERDSTYGPTTVPRL